MEFKIPRELKITYENRLNLKKLHELILELFDETRGERLKCIRKRIKAIKEEIPKTPIEIEIIDEKLAKLRKIRNIVKAKHDKEEYVNRAIPIIKAYKEAEDSDPVEKSILSSKQSESESNSLAGESSEITNEGQQSLEKKSDESEKQSNKITRKLIAEFIDVLQDYVGVKISRDGSDMIDETVSEIRTKNSAEDIDRKNFLKAFYEFQGRLNTKIPEDLLEKIDKFLKSYGLVTRKRAAKLPLDENGRKAGTSKKLMELALKRTGNQSYYNRINILCSICWGWKLPDLSSIEKKVMSDYDKTQKIFKSLNLDRSNLGVQFRLCKHLEQYKEELKELGYKFSKKDFKIVETREIILQYEETWKIMAVRTGLLPIETV